MLAVERGPAGRSVVTRAAARSPLQILLPRNHGHAVWAYLASHGGGLVNGDDTALHDALPARLCRALRDRIALGVVTNDIYTREDAELLHRHEALAPERIRAVETGGCSHAAMRGAGPVVFAQAIHGAGVPEVVGHVLAAWRTATGAR